ncbi:MAG: hypothetical protein ABSH38_10025 [Verrucomicrobiota bacterium]|jgi:hypothetical protein
MTQDITSALQEQFLARSRSFWHCIQASRFEQLREIAQRAMWRNLVWDWDELCISNLARQTAQLLDFVPSEVFAHPQALADAPALEEYYRILACLSANKLAQIISVDERHTPFALSRFLNVVISSRLEGMAIDSGQSLLYTIFAETEWQPEA